MANNNNTNFRVDFPDVADESWYLDNLAGDLLRTELFGTSSVSGFPVRIGASWIMAPAKVWLSGAWRTATVKVRIGSDWIPV